MSVQPNLTNPLPPSAYLVCPSRNNLDAILTRLYRLILKPHEFHYSLLTSMHSICTGFSGLTKDERLYSDAGWNAFLKFEGRDIEITEVFAFAAGWSNLGQLLGHVMLPPDPDDATKTLYLDQFDQAQLYEFMIQLLDQNDPFLREDSLRGQVGLAALNLLVLEEEVTLRQARVAYLLGQGIVPTSEASRVSLAVNRALAAVWQKLTGLAKPE